jgi:hypothetical protein
MNQMTDRAESVPCCYGIFRLDAGGTDSFKGFVGIFAGNTTAALDPVAHKSLVSYHAQGVGRLVITFVQFGDLQLICLPA